MPASEKYYFGYTIFLIDGHPVSVRRTKKLPRFLTLQVGISFGPLLTRSLVELPNDQKLLFLTEFRAEMSKAKIEGEMGSAYDRMDIVRLVSIDGLTPVTFQQSISQMHADGHLVTDTLILQFARLGLIPQTRRPSSPTPDKGDSPHSPTS